MAVSVRLKWLNRPFHWGWYVVVKRLVTPRILRTLSKKCATNFGPLSDNSVSGVPYVNTQC